MEDEILKNLKIFLENYENKDSISTKKNTKLHFFPRSDGLISSIYSFLNLVPSSSSYISQLENQSLNLPNRPLYADNMYIEVYNNEYAQLMVSLFRNGEKMKACNKEQNEIIKSDPSDCT